MADAALWAGAVVASAAAGGALVLRDPRQRAVAMALAVAIAPILLAADNWDDARVRDLRDSPLLLLGGVPLAAALLGGLAMLMRRQPYALPLLAFAALPFRIPVESGGETTNLLLPLYAVIAAGVIAEIARVVRAHGGPPERGVAPEPDQPGFASLAARWLPAALAAWLLVYALQGIYADDFSKALENIAFFLVPFAVLAALLLTVDWTPRLLRWLFALVIAEAVVFAVVGFAQYATRELFWNDAIIAANEIHSYFRVNSLFWDPNILGRYLVLLLIAVAAVMLWARSPRSVGAAGVLASGLLAALALTFSQSSLVALLAALAVLAALRWSVAWTAAACFAAALVALAAIAISDGSVSVETSGRDELIEGGLELAEDRPLAGYGSGSFQREFERRFRYGDERSEAVSHTEPVTVAAEQGVLGLAAYLAVIGLALAALAHRIRPWAPGLRGGGAALMQSDGPVPGVARAALLAGLVAMVVHSLSYAAFFIDPITWALVAVGLALAGRA
jgi:O-antigen ligase/polysaccharide polymerase Wzy-like membrane protein